MEHKSLNITRLHREHLIWLMDANYMLNEITFLQKLVADVKEELSRHDQHRILNETLNKLHSLGENLHSLMRDISGKDDRLQKAVRISLFNFDQFLIEEHCDCGRQLDEIKQSIVTLKENLYQYISEQKIRVVA